MYSGIVLVSFRCYFPLPGGPWTTTFVLVSFRCYESNFELKFEIYKVLVSFRCYVVWLLEQPCPTRFSFFSLLRLAQILT